MIDKNRLNQVMAMLEEGQDTTGMCLACGSTRLECEPDARNYPCHDCGKHEVFGLEEILAVHS
jgi:predicted RNA-binding Zn-ribbon protein involved in translation (DUF1610 family)